LADQENPPQGPPSTPPLPLGGAGGGTPEPGPAELNQWGAPEDKLRYAIVSWQRVTLLERNKMRR